jgi:hypothetical protein
MVNKYAGICNGCAVDVPAGCGTVHRVGRKWITHCADCVGMPEAKLASRGRCIDSPCCGCCDTEFAVSPW